MDMEKLYKTYYMQVYSYVMTIMKNSSAAEEITQDVFYRAIKNKDKAAYRGEAKESSWLCAIAHNCCMDALKKNQRFQQLDDQQLDGIRIEQQIEDQQMSLLIHKVLHDMEEPYKEVFQLRIFGELSFQNIGTIFGKSENWARVTYHRAKLKIQERMEHHE